MNFLAIETRLVIILVNNSRDWGDNMLARIKISDSLLETMALAAIEAYCLGDGQKGKQRQKLETYGYIWGTKKRCVMKM
ncbi:hypothetical protein MHY1_00528 [Methylovirgula sp. HY1]|nr:hypothetical protein MHY1_00528 [Methylovirgula sp. HY1]